MMQSLRISIVMFLLMTLLLGGLYPALTTGIIQGLFPDQAQGSLIKDTQGKVLGSRLIGQNFSKPEYFWGRLSATGPMPYNASSSSGSNLGVNNASLLSTVKARVDALQKADPGNKQRIPVDLVTASGSGLDPHISLAAAEYQIARVAKTRGLAPDAVRKMVEDNTEGRYFGLLGEPTVNVLMLNLELDERQKNNAADRR